MLCKRRLNAVSFFCHIPSHLVTSRHFFGHIWSHLVTSRHISSHASHDIYTSLVISVTLHHDKNKKVRSLTCWYNVWQE